MGKPTEADGDGDMSDKNLTPEMIDNLAECLANYQPPEPDRAIPLSSGDLGAKEIITMHATEFVDLDWKKLKAQGWEWFIYPNGMIKLRKK